MAPPLPRWSVIKGLLIKAALALFLCVGIGALVGLLSWAALEQIVRPSMPEAQLRLRILSILFFYAFATVGVALFAVFAEWLAQAEKLREAEHYIVLVVLAVY